MRMVGGRYGSEGGSKKGKGREEKKREVMEGVGRERVGLKGR